MAAGLVLRAVAHERHRFTLRQLLEQAKREFLSVVLDRAVASVLRTALKQLLLGATPELRPSEFAGQIAAKQCFAGAEIRGQSSS